MKSYEIQEKYLLRVFLKMLNYYKIAQFSTQNFISRQK